MSNSEFKLAVGKRVHDFRIQNNYTQFQFAELIDISVNFLSEIENGKKGMSQETICKLCSQFDLSADYILFGTTKAPENKSQSISQLIETANSLDSEDLDVLIQYLTSLKKLKTLDL